MSALTIYRPDPVTGELRPVSAAEHRAFLARRAAKRAQGPYGLWDLQVDAWAAGPFPTLRQAVQAMAEHPDSCVLVRYVGEYSYRRLSADEARALDALIHEVHE